MGRKQVKPIMQPDDTTCGPASIKHALHVLGIRKSLQSLVQLCKTNRNGTSTKNMINAITKLGLSVMAVENATLKHLQSALKYPPAKPRAALVSYLYDLNEKDEPHIESGHWAVVASFLSSTSRIVLLDSASGKRKSYNWVDFRTRWFDYDYKRRKVAKRGKKFRLVKSWQPQLLLIIAKTPDALPKFRISTAHVFTPSAFA
ncbi:MAG: cysteine peptidase family C39 domain-containing protein [Patescibacteria group bacterium]